MPGDWEAAHGLDPTVNGSALDPELDGVPISLECAASTDPPVKSTVASALSSILRGVSGEDSVVM